MAKRDEPGWGRSTIDIHRFLVDYGFADEVFLLEHTHGAEQLRARAAEWTFDRAATGADVNPELLERVAEMYAETSPAMMWRCLRSWQAVSERTSARRQRPTPRRSCMSRQRYPTRCGTACCGTARRHRRSQCLRYSSSTSTPGPGMARSTCFPKRSIAKPPRVCTSIKAIHRLRRIRSCCSLGKRQDDHVDTRRAASSSRFAAGPSD